MTLEMGFVFFLLFATIAVFIWDKFRMDLVALSVLTILALSGIITPAEAVAGFGSSVLLMIAGLFVVGEGLMRTGIAAKTGNWLSRIGKGSRLRLLCFLLPLVALLSAFMSSTGAVALLIPVVLSMVRQSKLSASQLMMPLAFASLIGGMLTLIGTPPNIIVSGALSKAGLEPFSFFDFTPVGLVILIVSMLYLLFIAPYLLPNHAGQSTNIRRSLGELADQYNIERRLYKMTLSKNSTLIGKTVLEDGLRTRFAATLFGIERHNRWVSNFIPVLLNTKVELGDTLWFYLDPEKETEMIAEVGLIKHPIYEHEIHRLQQSFGFAEVLVAPGSSLQNKTLAEANFRNKYGLNVVGISRENSILHIDYAYTRLREGDALLLAGAWAHIRRLGDTRDMVVFNTPVELDEAPHYPEKAPWAFAIMFGLLVIMATGLLPNLTAILVAALLMIISGCVSLNEAYRSLSPTSLILIAGMLPMATAMDKSGALAYSVKYITETFSSAGPVALSIAFFLLTSILSQFISNTATSVLMAPVAVSSAIDLGFEPEPFLMMVAIAASTAFATPIASPVNTLVLAPGGYRFSDFAKVGIGLQILVMIVALLVIPIIFPFH